MSDFTYKRTNVYSEISEENLKEIFDYCEGYKDFLNNAKTERDAVKTTVAMLKKEGYREYRLGDSISENEKLFLNNRGKSLFIIKTGKKSKAKQNGIKILVAHVDSPRLDLKQNPLYETNELAYLKTHYYGGIKKYQWLTIPLALHGVIVKKNGEKVDICIGEDDSDPIFYVSDLLPHLSQEMNVKKVSEAFQAENLNILICGIPLNDEEKKAVKCNALKLLNEKYGITEEDFLSAELEAVPAYKARDVGIDRAFIASYGHDDKVCAYPEITATLQTETDNTVITILADKEEIGSEGVTGMQCALISDILEEIASCFGMKTSLLRAESKCLSADVTAGYDPNYSSAFEDLNSCYLSHGAAMNKFTGSRGKSGSSDASAEYVGYLRNIFDKENVVWQMGELGRVDLGGGGTIAMYIANMNIDTVDLGVPVLSMHAPYELVSKADVYYTHKAFCAFIKN